jgi:monofunctional biosynthetic peptidoglycan transglycosylase
MNSDNNLIVHQEWIKIDEISKEVQVAVIASEDQLFAQHYGFDLKQIELALEESKSGKRNRGASTITQQVAKNLFLWQGKSWIRKAFEVYFTFLIELTWSKRRILEIYLNIVELGKGIFGVEAASQIYFDKSCSKLSSYEAALLAAVLPSPLKRSVTNPSNYLVKRANRIIREMKNIGGNTYLDLL